MLGLIRKIKEAKKKETTDRCQEIGLLQAKYDSFNLHKKVKDATETFKKRQHMQLIDIDGKLIINKQEIKNKCETYMETQF